jgi:excisionase family DNA binding protein
MAVILSAHPLMRTGQVAEKSSFCKATILRAVKQGRLRAIRFGPNSLRFTREDVEEFIQKGRGQ